MVNFISEHFDLHTTNHKSKLNLNAELPYKNHEDMYRYILNILVSTKLHTYRGGRKLVETRNSFIG